MNQLASIIRDMIRQTGAIPFRDFMNIALYHPEFGYYEQKKTILGKSGDFYTSPAVHPVFGQTIARDLYQKWKELGSPTQFLIVEYGAGQGWLARDILNEFRSSAPDLYSAVEYRIVEKSSYLQSCQQEELSGLPVAWYSTLEEQGPFTGVVLSNELIDAMPVHIIVETDKGPQEVFVTERNGQFEERLEPLSTNRINEYLQKFVVPLRPGQRIEVNLDAMDWMSQIAKYMKSGYLLTFDYGDDTSVLHDEGRMAGTLRGFREHQLQTNVLDNPGEIDITCDVNFTALMKHGEELGLKTEFFGTQSKFLAQAGIFQFLSDDPVTDPFRSELFKRNLAIKHLIMPGGMGERFKVLVQRKYGSEVSSC